MNDAPGTTKRDRAEFERVVYHAAPWCRRDWMTALTVGGAMNVATGNVWVEVGWFQVQEGIGASLGGRMSPSGCVCPFWSSSACRALTCARLEAGIIVWVGTNGDRAGQVGRAGLETPSFFDPRAFFVSWLMFDVCLHRRRAFPFGCWPFSRLHGAARRGSMCV